MLDAAMGVSPEKATAKPGGASARGSHRLAATHSCERLWTLRYEYGIVPLITKPWTLLGTLVHHCLAYHYAAQLPGEKPDWFSRPLDDVLNEEGAGNPSLIRTARDVYEFYKRHFAAGDTWSPVKVEHEFSATVGQLDPGGPFPELDQEVITARTDLLMEANGYLWIVDHKTTSGGWNSDRLPAWKDDGEYLMSWQAMLYLHIARIEMQDREVRGFIIQRVKRKAPYDVDRNVLRIPALAYRAVPRAARMMVKREKEIQARLALGESPTPNFAACQGRYGPCDYRDLCASETDEMKRLVMTSQYERRPEIVHGSSGAT
jgi:hypothetical protein